MAGSVIGALRVNLGLDSAEFIRGTKQAQSGMDKMSAHMKAVGIGLAASLSAAFVSIGKAAVEGAVAQRQAVAQVEAALASMGGAAGRTAEQLVAAADAMELRSLFDADVILKQVTANLLTFGNIAGEQFDRAQQAAIDMATRLGGEPQAAAIALGKALNDPIKGITALTRVGVQFTEQQKQQIAAMVEAGDVAGAQSVILAELERQFSGAAEAAADASPYRAFQVILGQIGDVIGEALLPSLFRFSEWLLANRAEILENANRIGDFISAVIDLGVRVASVASWVEERFGAIARAINFIINPLQTALHLLRGFGIIGGARGGGMVGDNPAANALRGLTAQSEGATRSLASLGASAAGSGDRLGRSLGGGARAASAAIRPLRDEVRDLVERLFPELGTRSKMAELALLDQAAAQGKITEQIRQQGRLRILGVSGERDVSGVTNEGPLDAAKRVAASADIVNQSLDELSGKTKVQTVAVADNFAQMSQRITGALQGLTNSIRSGDFLGILGGVLDIFTQLGSSGIFGQGLASRINAPRSFNGGGFTGMGARSGGLDGKGGFLAMLHPRESVTDHTKGGFGGGANINVTVGVDPATGNLTAFVDNRFARMAPAVGAAASADAVGRIQRMQSRRLA
jgi:hypothetical protein